MPIELQIALFLFLTAIAIVAYEMKSALQPATCPACPHCRAARLATEKHEAEVLDWYARRYGLRQPDDEDRRR